MRIPEPGAVPALADFSANAREPQVDDPLGVNDGLTVPGLVCTWYWSHDPTCKSADSKVKLEPEAMLVPLNPPPVSLFADRAAPHSYTKSPAAVVVMEPVACDEGFAALPLRAEAVATL